MATPCSPVSGVPPLSHLGGVALSLPFSSRPSTIPYRHPTCTCQRPERAELDLALMGAHGASPSEDLDSLFLRRIDTLGPWEPVTSVLFFGIAAFESVYGGYMDAHNGF